MTERRKTQKIEHRFFTDRELMIEAFYKEFFSWSAGNIGMWIAAGFFEFFLGVFMWMPYQGMQEMDMWIVICPFAMWGTTLYIQPYVQFQERGKNVKLYDKLQYLPISLKELQRYRIKKLAIFCFKMLLIFMVGQVFFSIICYHKITWGNILYVIIGGLLIPFGIGAIAERFTK